MCCVKKGANHPSAPIPEEGKWVRAKEIKDISGLTHGVGWCAPQQGACKLTLNIKDGIIQEAMVETLGCSGMTHSAAMASEILPGKTLLEALNTDLVLRRHQHGDARTVPANRLRTQPVGLFRRRTSDRSFARRPRQRIAQPGGNDVRHGGQRHPLPRNGRRLLHPHGARRRRPSDRLRICPPRQIYGHDQKGRQTPTKRWPRPKVRTAVSPKRSNTSTRARNNPFCKNR